MADIESENDYIKNLRKSDREAWQDIIRIYYPVLCRFAERLLTSQTESEDVVTDIFVNIWQQDLKFSSTNQLKKYLYTAVRNRCLNIVRDRSRERKKHENFASIYLHTDDAIENEIIYTELLAEIRKEMESLSPRMKEVFYLAYFKELSNEEIAENLNLSNQTVRNQKTSALSILRKAIKPRLQTSVITFFLCFQGF